MANRRRHLIQGLFVAGTNSYLPGFLEGSIYSGALKNFCLPGLNCYSCPGALGSCPLGALQIMLGSAKYHFTFYVLGFFALVGGVIGRFVCGWLCPFGLAQDLLHKLPTKKLATFKGDHQLRYLKYLILLVFVVLLPLTIRGLTGEGTPWFCKLICPSGTLLGGFPLLIASGDLRQVVGLLFGWKTIVLLLILAATLFVSRPFCKYLCPLGAIYGLFNKVSLFQLRHQKSACINCGKCAQVCPMTVDPVQTQTSPECIRCLDCVQACPTKALAFGVTAPKKQQVEASIGPRK